MANLTAILRLVRAGNCLMAAAAVWVGAYLTAGFTLAPDVLAAMVGAFLVCGAGNVVNDLCDVAGDRLNHPSRPLVTGAISERTARVLALLLHLLALPIVAVANSYVFAAAIFSILLLLAYNFWLKRVVLVGNLAVALLTSLAFLCGGLAADIDLALVLPGPLVAAVFAFFFHLIREVVKDTEDIGGDTVARIRTLPQVVGRKSALGLCLALFCVLVVLTLVPLRQGWYGPAYEIIVIALIDLPLLVLLIWTFLRPSEAAVHWSRAGLKVGMIFGLLALVLA